MDRVVVTGYPNPKPTAQAVVNLDRGTFFVLQEGADLTALEGLPAALAIPAC